MYSQPTRAYNPPANLPQYTYNQATYNQANGYNLAPGPSLNYQGGNRQQHSAPASTSSQPSTVFSPSDSSSYRWRESFVKLRAQEQERSLRLSRKNWRSRKDARKSRTHKSSRKVSVNTVGDYGKQNKRRKDPNKLQNSLSTNVAKQFKDQDKTAWQPSRVNEKTSQISGNVFHSSSKKMADVRKSYGEPGIFLRKKASRSNSFLAFLPHEVAKDESLLESVYNMLSQMLKNLRKHKKYTKTSRSMKTLKQYLKLPRNENQGKKTGKITPKETSNNENNLNILKSGPNVSRKFHPESQKAEFHESSSRTKSSHFPARLNSGNNLLKRQKQLSKQHSVEIHLVSNRWQRQSSQVTYSPRYNGSNMSNHHSLSDVRVAERPSHVFKIDNLTTPGEAMMLSNYGIPKILEHELHDLNHTKNKNNSTLVTPPQRINSSRSSSSSKNFPSRSSSRRESPTSTEKQSAGSISAASHTLNGTRGRQIKSKMNERPGGHSHTRYKEISGHLLDNSLKNDNSVNAKDYGTNHRKLASNKVKFSHEPRQKSKSGKGMTLSSRVKPKGKKILKIDGPLVKEMNTNGKNEALVEQSDEDIISTIVQLLENEKNKRKGKRHKHEKRTHNKRQHRNPDKKLKRISKKDHVQKFSGNDEDNLMEEEEDYIKLERGRS